MTARISPLSLDPDAPLKAEAGLDDFFALSAAARPIPAAAAALRAGTRWVPDAADNDTHISRSGPFIFRHRTQVAFWADRPAAPSTATVEPGLFTTDLNVTFTVEPAFEQAWHDLRAIRPAHKKSDDDFARTLTPYIMECVYSCAKPARMVSGSIAKVTLDMATFESCLKSHLGAHLPKDVAVILALVGVDTVVQAVLRTTRRLSYEHELHRNLRQQALIIRHLERLMQCATLPEADHRALLSFYAQFDDDLSAYAALTGLAVVDDPLPKVHRSRSFFDAPLSAFYQSARAAARLFGKSA